MAIPTMSLKAINFNPIAFTPSEYKFQPADMTFLEKSLAQREARREKASQARSAVDKALGEIEMKLNPTESKWFEDYKQNIKDQIQYHADAGNYGAAYRTATELAGATINDPKVLGRMRSQDKYTKTIQELEARRNKGDFGQDTWVWWNSNPKNQYYYNDPTDGNYEGALWQPGTPIYNDIDPKTVAATAFKLLSPDKYTNSEVKDIEKDNVRSTTRNHYEKINANDILDRIDEIIATTSDGLSQVEQMHKVAVDSYNRLKREYDSMSDDDPDKVIKGQMLDNRRKLLFDNKGEVDYKTFYARVIHNELFAKGLAYEWKDDYNSKINLKLSNDTSPGSTPLHPNNLITIPPKTENYQGVNIQVTEEYDSNSIIQAGDAVQDFY